MSNLAHSRQQLERPFPLSVVEFKPQVMSKDKKKGMAATYVDARAVAARLDDVFGFGWSASYRVVNSDDRLFVVECTLTVQVDGQTVSRADVGESSNGEREASRHKSAYSDALKRAAVQFGVGRYLYDLPKLWAEYDDQKRSWTDAGLKTLENRYEQAIKPLLTAPAGPVAQQPAAHAAQAQAAPAEPLIGEQAGRELFGELSKLGLAYDTDTNKKKVRGFVQWLNHGTVDGLPDSIKEFTAREADAAIHSLRANGAELRQNFIDYVNELRAHAA